MRYMLLGGFGHVGAGILDGLLYNTGGTSDSDMRHIAGYLGMGSGVEFYFPTPGLVSEVCVVDNQSNPRALYLAGDHTTLAEPSDSKYSRYGSIASMEEVFRNVAGYLEENFEHFNLNNSVYPTYIKINSNTLNSQKQRIVGGYVGGFNIDVTQRRGMSSFPINNAVEVGPLKLRYLNADILDTDLMIEEMRSRETVVVINAAGKYGEMVGNIPNDDYQRKYQEYYEANNLVAISAFQAAISSGVKRFVQIVPDSALMVRPEAILTSLEISKVRINPFFLSQVELIKELRLLAASAISSGVDIDLIFIGVPELNYSSVSTSHCIFSTLASTGNPMLGDLIPYLKDNLYKSSKRSMRMDLPTITRYYKNPDDYPEEDESTTKVVSEVIKSQVTKVIDELKTHLIDTIHKAFVSKVQFDEEGACRFIITGEGKFEGEGLSDAGNMHDRLRRVIELIEETRRVGTVPEKKYHGYSSHGHFYAHPVAVGIHVWNIAASWVLTDRQGDPKIFHNKYIQSMVGKVHDDRDFVAPTKRLSREPILLVPHIFEPVPVDKTPRGIYSFFLTEFTRSTSSNTSEHRTFRRSPSDSTMPSIVSWTDCNVSYASVATGISFLGWSKFSSGELIASSVDWWPKAASKHGGKAYLGSDYVESFGNPWAIDNRDNGFPRPFSTNWMGSPYINKLGGFIIEHTPLACDGISGKSPRGCQFRSNGSSSTNTYVTGILNALSARDNAYGTTILSEYIFG